ncbi:MAG: hypothetical protein QW575_08820 [Thermoproteota archaeon]
MSALDQYVQYNTFTQDTYVSCSSLLNSNDCQDIYGDTFEGLIALDSSVGQIKNIVAVVNLCNNNCPMVDEIKRIKYYHMVANDLLAISQDRYTLYYVSDGNVFDTESSYSDIQNNTNTEPVSSYLNTNFNDEYVFIASRPPLAKSLGWWVWTVNLYADPNSNKYSISFINDGYSNVCPYDYKTPIQVSNGQILSIGQVQNPNASYITAFPSSYLEGFCLPATEAYVSLSKTLPTMNNIINMSNYVAPASDCLYGGQTPAYPPASYTPNGCCAPQDQPTYCVDVYHNWWYIPYWMSGFFSFTNVSVAHYLVKAGSKYYQIFYMQPMWASIYNGWRGQTTFGVIIDSNPNGVDFGFNWPDDYTLSPSLLSSLFWINWEGTLW